MHHLVGVVMNGTVSDSSAAQSADEKTSARTASRPLTA